MKIRTDFVTNSSSSSYVRVIIKTKDGKRLSGGFDSGNNDMIGSKDFNVSKKFFEELSGGEALVAAMKKWFKAGFDNKSLVDKYDYSTGSLEEIAKLEIEDIDEIELSSLIDYEMYTIGSDISYNYQTKERKRTDTSEGEPDDMW